MKRNKCLSLVALVALATGVTGAFAADNTVTYTIKNASKVITFNQNESPDFIRTKLVKADPGELIPPGDSSNYTLQVPKVGGAMIFFFLPKGDYCYLTFDYDKTVENTSGCSVGTHFVPAEISGSTVAFNPDEN